MILTTDSQVIHGVERKGFYHYTPILQGGVFIYRGDQYWRIKCKFGDFELVRFKTGYPREDLMIQGIPEEAWQELWRLCQTLRLILDPFKEMATLGEKDEIWKTDSLLP